jgi:hypothetical protein
MHVIPDLKGWRANTQRLVVIGVIRLIYHERDWKISARLFRYVIEHRSSTTPN